MSKDGPIFHKFNVTRTDGKDAPGEKHDGCLHWVLDVTHDTFAAHALTAYADACEDSHPELAANIRSILLNECGGKP